MIKKTILQMVGSTESPSISARNDLLNKLRFGLDHESKIGHLDQT